ncbi:MAG: universal stress protein [Spirochaetes bacterium]|nr:universal stress protein [Spirochaetota bacterium]
MNTIKNILVATDFTSSSRAALDEAVALAEQVKSTVYVVHAVDKIEECAVDYCLSEEQVAGEKTKLINEARSKLDAEINRLRNHKGVTILSDIRYGKTIDEILQEEREKNINLLVIGPHPRKTAWQRFRTHLSEKLIERSNCDTLVVHTALQ